MDPVVEMGWQTGYLDIVLVPLGIMLLVIYHLYLWHRVRHAPQTTVIGVNHLNRQAWVRNIMSVCQFSRPLK